MPVVTDLNHQLITDLDATFPKVVEMMGARLYSGLRRMTGNPQEAEDLTQETLIRAYRALTDYEPDRVASLKLEPWVWTIALNLGRNHLRDRTRRPTPVVDVDRSLLDPEPVDTTAWDRRFSALSRAKACSSSPAQAASIWGGWRPPGTSATPARSAAAASSWTFAI